MTGVKHQGNEFVIKLRVLLNTFTQKIKNITIECDDFGYYSAKWE